MPLTKPFNNNVLIEIIRDDDGVSRSYENETLKEGKLIAYSVFRYHLTASSYGEIDTEDIAAELDKMFGKTVRWEEYAEGGQTFEEDGKTYALIPFWRLIGVKE